MWGRGKQRSISVQTTARLHLETDSLRGKPSFRRIGGYVGRRWGISLIIYSGVLLGALFVIARYSTVYLVNPTFGKAFDLKSLVTGLVAAAVFAIFIKTEGWKTTYIKRAYFYAPELQRIVNEKTNRYQLTSDEAYLLLEYRGRHLLQLEHVLQYIRKGRHDDLLTLEEFGSVKKEVDDGYVRLNLYWSTKDHFFLLEEYSATLEGLR